VQYLIPYAFQLKQLDQMKYELATTKSKEQIINAKEL